MTQSPLAWLVLALLAFLPAVWMHFVLMPRKTGSARTQLTVWTLIATFFGWASLTTAGVYFILGL